MNPLPTYSSTEIIFNIDGYYENEMKALQWIVREEKDRYTLDEYAYLQQLFYQRWQELRNNTKAK